MSATLVAPAPSARSRSALSVSVVICAYTAERWTDLEAAIQSVRAQTAPAAELIVVADHNASLAARARDAHPEVRVLENRHARGLSGARNTGVEAATGDVVAFLDDDAVAAPDWLERVVAAYRPEVLGVGGAAEPAWPSARPRWFPPEFDWVVGCTYRGLPESAAPVRNLIGANMSLRREVLEGVGGFEVGLGRVGKLPLGCEETDLCIRAGARSPGETFVFEPRARVAHTVTPERTTLRYFAARCYAEGRSKAIVARRSGAGSGLSTERSYSLRTLPRGIARGLADAVRRRDPFGLARAVAIAGGFCVTLAGYVAGTAVARDR
jgi:GT2 family glycosyltransferase